MAVLCFLIIVTVAGVDLGVKQYIEKHVKSNEERNILQKRGILRKVHNKGMIMNRLECYPLFVQLASVFALGIMMLWQAFLLKKPGCRMEKAGVALKPIACGGGCDANVLAGKGFTLPNVGVGVRDCHTTKEKLILKEFFAAFHIVLETLLSYKK